MVAVVADSLERVRAQVHVRRDRVGTGRPAGRRRPRPGLAPCRADWTDRLRKRLESERKEIEELTASELKRLGENSRRVARNTLSTIERDTEEATGKLRELLAKAWVRSLIVRLRPDCRWLLILIVALQVSIPAVHTRRPPSLTAQFL